MALPFAAARAAQEDLRHLPGRDRKFVSDEGSALLPKSAPGDSIFRPPRPKPKAPADGRGGDARDPKRDGTTVEDSEHEQSAA